MIQYYKLYQIMRNRKTIKLFKCPKDYPTDKICSNIDCRFEAVFCYEQDCTQCRQSHDGCNYQNLYEMSARLYKRRKMLRDTAQKLVSLQKQSFNKCMKEAQYFLAQDQLGQYDALVKDLTFFQQDKGASGKCGADIKHLYQALDEKRYVQPINRIKIDYTKKLQKMMKQLQKEREGLLISVFGTRHKQFTNFSRQKQKEKEEEEDEDEEESEWVDILSSSKNIQQPGSYMMPIIIEDSPPPSPVQRHQEQQLPRIPQQEIQSSLEKDKMEAHLNKKVEQSQKPKSKPQSWQQDKNQQSQSQSIGPEIPQIITIDSNILKNDRKGSIKQQYLLQQLQRPQRLQLIFRASDHHFDPMKFHKICDGRKQTVTIIKTEFNRTIAGYAQPNWTSIGYYDEDKQKKSFLLQLNQMKRLDLIPKKYKKALYCNIQFGPSFGSDLVISAQQNKDTYIKTNFPDCYNSNSIKFANKKKSKAFLCGCTQKSREIQGIRQSKYLVQQYEVFKVIR